MQQMKTTLARRADDSLLHSYAGGVSCPFCGFGVSHTKDSRCQKDGTVRRRRECEKCQQRFTTWESTRKAGDFTNALQRIAALLQTSLDVIHASLRRQAVECDEKGEA